MNLKQNRDQIHAVRVEMHRTLQLAKKAKEQNQIDTFLVLVDRHCELFELAMELYAEMENV